MKSLKSFFERTLEQLPLWRMLFRFNAHPFAQSCPFEKESDKLFFALFRTVSRGLPDRYRKSVAQKDSYFWDFSNESQKILLLDDRNLTALAQIVGVTLHSKRIAHCIQKEEIVAIKGIIGDALFSYALLRGQFVVGSAVNLLSVLGGTRTDIFIDGWKALWLIAVDWQKALKDRFTSHIVDLSIPSESEDRKEEFWKSLLVLEKRRIPAATRTVLWHLVKKCLVWEVAPSWTQFFTP